MVYIHAAHIVAYSKSYSAKIKNIIFDTVSDVDSNDYDTKINQEKAKLNDNKSNVDLPDTYVKITYSNIEVNC